MCPEICNIVCFSPLSVYKKNLEKELKGETSGDLAKLVVALLNVSVYFLYHHLRPHK